MRISCRKLSLHPFRVLLSVTLATVIGASAARAQWSGPTGPAPTNNLPPPIWNSAVSGATQSASFDVSGSGRVGTTFTAGSNLTVGGSGGFGGFSPDPTWEITSPGLYVGDGVKGTVIGAGGGQTAGDIKTDGNLNVVGSVGIGTASPSAKLEVSQVTSEAGGNGFTITGTGAGAQSWQWYPSATQSLLLMRPGLRLAMFGNDGSFAVGGLGNDAGVGADFFVNGTTGNVGVGNTGPASKLDVTGNINSSGDVIGGRLCIGADCRNTWPAAGGGGDITAVNVGAGVTGGGASGDVTVSLDQTFANGLYVNSSGDVMTGDLTLSGIGSDLVVSGDINAQSATSDIVAGGDVQGMRLCIGADCRNAWPVGGGAGDITGVTAGTGLGGGGMSGDVTLNVNTSSGVTTFGDSVVLDTVFTDGQYVNTTGDQMTGGLNIAGMTSNLIVGGTATVGASIPGFVDLFFGAGGNYLRWDGNSSFEFNRVVGFRNGLNTFIGSNSTFSGPVQVTGGNNLVVVGGQILGRTCALTGATCTSGAPWTDANTISASQFCLDSPTECITSWPAGGGAGDITGVTAGSGLTGGGLAGDVTLNVGAGTGVTVAADTISLDTTYTDGRYVNVTGDTMTGNLVFGNGLGVNALNNGVVAATTVCVGATCKTAWPDGDITAVLPGVGLKGGGSAGSVTLEVGAGTGISVVGDHVDLDTSFTDTRYVNVTGDNITGFYRINNGGICANDAAGSCPAMAAGGIYGDLAYSQFDVAEYILSREDLKPGEVVVIDPKATEQVLRSRKSNDTAVAGVVSTDPGVLGGYTLEEKPGTHRIPLTLAGRVPVKVSAENGPVKPGDLLTTAKTPGHAMRCSAPLDCVGSTLGKAMGTLSSGTGVIPVLITLK